MGREASVPEAGTALLLIDVIDDMAFPGSAPLAPASRARLLRAQAETFGLFTANDAQRGRTSKNA